MDAGSTFGDKVDYQTYPKFTGSYVVSDEAFMGYGKSNFLPIDPQPSADTEAGLTVIDHLTHNVHRGRMAEWADFYERLFNFREIR